MQQTTAPWLQALGLEVSRHLQTSTLKDLRPEVEIRLRRHGPHHDLELLMRVLRGEFTTPIFLRRLYQRMSTHSRSRKVKCDGSHPCSRCQKAHTPCEVPDEQRRRGPDREPGARRRRTKAEKQYDDAITVRGIDSTNVSSSKSGISFNPRLNTYPWLSSTAAPASSNVVLPESQSRAAERSMYSMGESTGRVSIPEGSHVPTHPDWSTTRYSTNLPDTTSLDPSVLSYSPSQPTFPPYANSGRYSNSQAVQFPDGQPNAHSGRFLPQAAQQLSGAHTIQSPQVSAQRLILWDLTHSH